MDKDEQIADSITRYLVGHGEYALKELKDLIGVVTPVANDANTEFSKSAEKYNKYYARVYAKVLAIVQGR